jgi:hypothetical protein
MHRFKNNEKSCEKIPHLEKEIATSVNLSQNIEKKIDNELLVFAREQKEKSASIDKNIHALITFLSTKHTDMQGGFFIAKSPIQLTDSGIEILKATGGDRYVEGNLQYLISEMEKETYKSALDVQTFARTLLIKEIDSDQFTSIKNYIFQHPTYKIKEEQIPIDIGIVTSIIAIYLRDKYFEKHPALRDVDPS